MHTFDHRFTVRAPLAAVAEFHGDTRALRALTPPPMFVQLHHFDPLAEGAVAEFTLWLGVLPIRWVAVHTDVDKQRGFTDTMARGPMAHWVHRHTFASTSPNRTDVTDHIEYEYKPGLAGLVGRLLMSRPGLAFLFAYRGWATRRAVERRAVQGK
jgi:ligand-binding SRPBCC domain-containing protein